MKSLVGSRVHLTSGGGGLHWNGWTRRNREEDGDWTTEKSGKVTHISPGTYQILILSLQLILSVSPMSDMWPGSSLMGLLCTRTMLMRGVGTTNLFHPYHCYDYRAAYLNPYMIHKTLENKQWKWSCQLLCAIGFSPRRWQNSLLWITLPKKITVSTPKSHWKEHHTHIHTASHRIPGKAQLTQHQQWPMGVRVYTGVCFIRRAEENDQLNQWPPQCMVWTRKLKSKIQYWHRRKCHGSAW